MNELAQTLQSGKRFKVFFVEVDDDDRERVIAGTVDSLELEQQVDYANVYSDTSFKPVHRFADSVQYLLRATLVPNEDGTMLRVENFSEPEEEDEDEHSQDD